nr:hypothetical protein [Hyphomonas sp. 34-62-18]
MSKEADTLELTLAAATPGEEAPAGEREGRRIDFLQLGFWACLLLSIAAASISLAWPNASGATGSILL